MMRARAGRQPPTPQRAIAAPVSRTRSQASGLAVPAPEAAEAKSLDAEVERNRAQQHRERQFRSARGTAETHLRSRFLRGFSRVRCAFPRGRARSRPPPLGAPLKVKSERSNTSPGALRAPECRQEAHQCLSLCIQSGACRHAVQGMNPPCTACLSVFCPWPSRVRARGAPWTE